MSKLHRGMQTQGHRIPSAAQIASGTSSTYGGISELSSSSTSPGLGKNLNLEITTAPPVPSDYKNTPITLGHLQISWKVLMVAIPLIAGFAGGVWWISQVSSKVEKHDEDIKESKGKTEKLLIDSAAASAKLQKLDSQVGKLEDKMFEQALTRPKKQ